MLIHLFFPLQDSGATVMTSLKKRVKHVGIFLKDEDEQGEDDGEDKENEVEEALGRGARGAKIMASKTRVCSFERVKLVCTCRQSWSKEWP